MEKRDTMDCTVLMAGAYPFKRGKKIDIQKKGDLYYASSGGMDFGLIKEIGDVEEKALLLPERFHGVVMENHCEEHLLKICIPIPQIRFAQAL